MPRPKAPKITAVTEALLRERWENANICRMWLRRRGTSAVKLGLVVVADGSRVKLVHAADAAAAPTAPVSMDDEAFEKFAGEVDDLLQAADEGPEVDETVHRLMLQGLSPKDAAQEIVRLRFVAKGVVPEVVSQTNAARAEAVHKDSEPVVAAASFFVQLGASRDAAECAALAERAAKLLKLDAFVCSSLDGAISHTFHAPARAAHTRAPAQVKDHWPKVAPLLERPRGATVDEVKRAIGWKTAPGKWFFEKWAAAAGRGADLVDLGHVDGERRFGLREARR